MRKILWVAVAAAGLWSCGDGVRIKGRIVCKGDKETIYLESVAPGNRHAIDSVATGDGKFSFRLPPTQDGEPMMYNLRCGEHVIPLLVRTGEKVVVRGVGNVSRNYTVEGSEGSAKMKELAVILNNGAASLDSLNNIYTRLDPADTTRRGISREYLRTYYDVKRAQIGFIVSNPGSLAAIYGLYQRLPNDNTLFNDPQTDIVYYRMVADSVALTHPASPYLAALREDIARMDGSAYDIDPAKVHVVNYPDINLPDMYGQNARLSAFDGQVILIDFWSANSKQCLLNNADLIDIYDDLHTQGFEVYQVSTDTSKPLWVTAVQDQKLPWTTVCDFRGNASQPVRLYNIRSVPANFLLDRQGNIVGKNLYGKKLEEQVKQLL